MMNSTTVTSNFTPRASGDYPKYHMLSQQHKNGWDDVRYPSKILSHLVGADCWGVYVKHPDESITPLINIYALFNEIGRSFGLNCKPTPQYMYECEVRNKIIQNPVSILNQLRPNDSLYIYLGGSIFRYAIFTKTGDGKGWKYNDYYNNTLKPYPKM